MAIIQRSIVFHAAIALPSSQFISPTSVRQVQLPQLLLQTEKGAFLFLWVPVSLRQAPFRFSEVYLRNSENLRGPRPATTCPASSSLDSSDFLFVNHRPHIVYPWLSPFASLLFRLSVRPNALVHKSISLGVRTQHAPLRLLTAAERRPGQAPSGGRHTITDFSLQRIGPAAGVHLPPQRFFRSIHHRLSALWDDDQAA
ncbi:hypothetical protein L596_023544 [Steinernema carpocapsae]|uniref:Uncharacterized protein n=1 Tax=Steinernema carpocapsae TaxID=34508 RepID=A0A4U5MER7_STECR|nr:hypothetical protein L596_023544 [Steinernema carpocapsae]